MVITSSALAKYFAITQDVALAIGILIAVIHNFTWHYFTTWKERIGERTIKDYLTRLIHYKMYTLPIDLIVITQFTKYLLNHHTFYSADLPISLPGILITGSFINSSIAKILATVPGAIIKFILNDVLVFRMKKIKQKKAEESEECKKR